MNPQLIGFAMSQIWQLPFLLLFVVGLFLAASRRDLGRAQSFAVVGFGLLTLGIVLQAVQMYQIYVMRADGDYRSIASTSAIFSLGNAIVRLAGFVMLMFAIFIDRGVEPAKAPPATQA